MKVAFISDIHANFELYADICNEHEDTIQVGDFGIGFGIEAPVLDKRHRWIRGNHDNPSMARAHPNWIPDGSVEVIGSSKVMFIGGAYSVDKHARRENVNWWADEQCSYADFSRFMSDYEIEKPDVMVTHDCPAEFAKLFLLDAHKQPYASVTNIAFDEMFKIHKPKLWIFGHWHLNIDQMYYGTRFLCQDHIRPAGWRGPGNRNVLVLDL